MLVCRECVVHQHLDCPGVMSAEDHAREERETVKRCRVKYAQVGGVCACVRACVHDYYFYFRFVSSVCVYVRVCVSE